jgi:hypothetical protein
MLSGTVVVALGLFASPAQALLCPQLVKDCQTLIAKVEKKGGNASKIREAKEHCQRAQQLHEQGKHVDSVIQAGKGVEEAGEALK